MSTEQLTAEAMSLPLPERIRLAQALWESIEDEPSLTPEGEIKEAVAIALRRDAEIESGQEIPLSHDQVMEAAHRAIGCA